MSRLINSTVARVIVVTMLACAPNALKGYPREPLRLQALVDASDCIAIGDIDSINHDEPGISTVDGRLVKGTAEVAHIRTSRTLMGSCPAEIRVRFFTPVQWMGYPGLQTGPQLVFLRKEGGELAFTDRHYPSLPAMRRDSASTPDPRTPIELVVDELGNILASPLADAERKWSVIAIAYAIPKSIESFNSSLQVALRATADPELQHRIGAELIRRGNVTALKSAANSLSNGAVSEAAKSEYLSAIANDLRNPDAVPTLGGLVRSGTTSVRRAAMEALWHIGALSSAELLVGGLGDSDSQVRFYAVRALADIYNDPDWGPAQELFDQEENRYVSHWEQWSTNNLPNRR